MVAVAATAGSYIGIGAMIPEHGNPYMVIVLRFWGRGVGAVVALLVLAPYICLQVRRYQQCYSNGKCMKSQ